MIITPLISCIFLYLGTLDFRIDLLSYPSSKEIIIQIIFFIIMEDVAFYWVHRALHIPFLYKHFHKRHHDYKITIGIASEYTLPLEFILINLIPTSLGSSILGNNCHIIT